MNSHITNGQSGGQLITADSNLHVPNPDRLGWGVLQIEDDTVLDSASVGNIDGLAASGRTLVAGRLYFGRWTALKLTSGALIAYYIR